MIPSFASMSASAPAPARARSRWRQCECAHPRQHSVARRLSQQKPPARNDLAKVLKTKVLKTKVLKTKLLKTKLLKTRVLKDLVATAENPDLSPWPPMPTPTITAQVPD